MNAMPSKDKAITRRSFLGWLMRGSLAGSILVGLGVLLRYMSYPSEASPPSQYDLGSAAEYPVGTRKVVTSTQAVIIHDDQGFHALSLACPHLGCMVTETSDGFTCPCHGSRFLHDGSLRNGPASLPLKSLRAAVSAEGHLILYTNP